MEKRPLRRVALKLVNKLLKGETCSKLLSCEGGGGVIFINSCDQHTFLLIRHEFTQSDAVSFGLVVLLEYILHIGMGEKLRFFF